MARSEAMWACARWYTLEFLPPWRAARGSRCKNASVNQSCHQYIFREVTFPSRMGAPSYVRKPYLLRLRSRSLARPGPGVRRPGRRPGQGRHVERGDEVGGVWRVRCRKRCTDLLLPLRFDCRFTPSRAAQTWSQPQNRVPVRPVLATTRRPRPWTTGCSAPRGRRTHSSRGDECWE